jgi:hypothetical protein
MWFESKATRRQKVTPFIIAYLKITDDHNMLCVHIKNIGEGCAKDVEAKLIKDFNQFGEKNILYRIVRYSRMELIFFRRSMNLNIILIRQKILIFLQKIVLLNWK